MYFPDLIARELDRRSAQDLADAVGCSAQTVRTWRTGFTRPHASQLRALRDALGISADELVESLADHDPESDHGAVA